MATPTKAAPRRRQTTAVSRVSGVSDDGAFDGDGDEWKLDSTPDVLMLGAPAGSQEAHASGDDEVPPESSSPGDPGGFDSFDTPVRGGGRGRVLVGDTPTKTR